MAKSKRSKRPTPQRNKPVKSVKKPAKPRKLIKPKKAPARKMVTSARAAKATKPVKSKPVKSAKVIKPAKPVKAAAPVAKMQRPAPVPPAVMGGVSMTSGKPKKNQAGLLSRDLEHYRSLLLVKRRELLGDMSSMEREALRSTTGSNLSNLPIHMADMGTDNYEQEFTLGLVEKDRVLLRDINQTLAKIQDGTFGVCEGTGKPIGKARLEAQPWAKYSIEYARKLEMGMMRAI